MASRQEPFNRPTPTPTAPQGQQRVVDVEVPQTTDASQEPARPFDELQLAVFASIRSAAKTRRRVQ